MSQLLIAVKSCLKDLDRGCHDAIRGTWGQAFRGKAIVKFFVGAETDGKTSRNYKSDEFVVDAPDGYNGLVFKTRAICQYMIGKNLDNVLLVDTDCCVYPKKVFNAGYEMVDYTGRFNGEFGGVGPRDVVGKAGNTETIDRCYSWASGAGYFLSRRAAFEIAETFPREQDYIAGSYEDLWVGQVLGPLVAKGELISLPLAEPVAKYFLRDGHSKGYDPKSGWMEEAWREFV